MASPRASGAIHPEPARPLMTPRVSMRKLGSDRGGIESRMDRQGISKIKRAELVARLVALDQQIEAQAARIRQSKAMGWDMAPSQKRLVTLEESRRLYRSALKHLLGNEAVDESS